MPNKMTRRDFVNQVAQQSGVSPQNIHQVMSARAKVLKAYHEGGLVTEAVPQTATTKKPIENRMPTGSATPETASPLGAATNEMTMHDGGRVQGYATGGQVVQPGRVPGTGGGGARPPRGATPQGDNVKINAQTGEFVVPKDVVTIKGTEFFEKLLMTARKGDVEAKQRRQGQTAKRVQSQKAKPPGLLQKPQQTSNALPSRLAKQKPAQQSLLSLPANKGPVRNPILS